VTHTVGQILGQILQASSNATSTTSSSQTSFLLDLAVLAIFALVFSTIFARLKLSIVAGQILAGVLVGPFVLGWVKDSLVLNQLSEIGVVLLLFIIGLELDPTDLRRMFWGILSLTALEVGISFLFGLLASYLLGFNFLESIIFAMSAGFTSTAIVGKIFLSRKILRSPESGFLLGMLVVEDMFAVVFLIALSALTSSNIGTFPYYVVGVSASSRGIVAGIEAIAGGLALVGLGYGVSHYIAPRIINFLSHFDDEFEEIPFLFGLGLAFVFAVIAAELGYSPGTGAFIVGLTLRGKQSKFLSRRVAPIKDLFLVLFFVSMGGLIDPSPALVIGFPIIIAVTLLVLGKFAGGYSVGKILNYANRNLKLRMNRDAKRGTFTLGGTLDSASSFGVWFIPRGEFSLIIGQFALSLRIIDQPFFSLIGISVLVTTLVASILLRYTEPKRAQAIYAFRGEQDSDGV
jgi:CPA2 family monovalent cation:H+ antiporter-2